MIFSPWAETSAPTWIIPGFLFGGAMGSKERHYNMPFFAWSEAFAELSSDYEPYFYASAE